MTTFTYTPRAQVDHEVKGNGNTVDYTYFLNQALQHQVEKKPDGTVVAEHTYDYDPDGNQTLDDSKVQNADNHAAYINRTTTSAYDPRDRLATVTKTDAGTTVSSESYVHDPNNNVVSQTINGTTTAFTYNRNRLVEGLTDGVTSAYSYDPFGRLNTVTSGGQAVERHTYDGFDRVIELRRLNGFADYTYDPLDRTKTRLTFHGAGSTKQTDFTYIGLTDQLANEATNSLEGQSSKSYQYSPTGQRLSQTVHNLDSTVEDGYYGYNAHSDVEDLTTSTGDTKTTYGYTAYGDNDPTAFTGIDPPDPNNSFDTPYNVYRFNAKRFDSETGNYDMGFRDYNPGLNQFLTRDTYNGALADMGLTTDPYTGNRYAYGAGNPLNNIELDGHLTCQKPDGYDCGKAPDYDRETGRYEPTVIQASGTSEEGRLSPDTPHNGPEYQQPSFWDELWHHAEIKSAILTYGLAEKTICNFYDELACDLWKHYGSASGEPFTVNPADLAKDPDFGDRVSASQRALSSQAATQCKASSETACTFKIDSLWRDGSFENDASHLYGIGNFKYRMEGSVAVKINSDGSVTVRGSYSLSVYKRWNFDANKKVHPAGVSISLYQFSQMPRFGIAAPFDMSGTSSGQSFALTLPR